MFSFAFNLSCLLFLTLIMAAYILKKKIPNTENKIYKKLLVTSYLGITIDIIGYIIMQLSSSSTSLQNEIIAKIYLIYFIVWIVYFKDYIFAVTTNNKNKLKQHQKISFVNVILFAVLDLLIPIKIVNKNGMIYSSGLAVLILYLLVSIYILYMIYLLIKHYKVTKINQKIPLLAFIILGIIVMIIQFIKPEILLITATECFITCLMYFTIENPDMKLLKEMHDAKEISDNANEEKTLFLYNMTQEIRETTKNIDNEADIIIDSDNLSDDKESARNIKSETSKFRMMTNDIFDISAVEASSIKIYNNKYNIKTILKEVVNIYNNSCKSKNIEFRTNIEHNIPDTLYGDSISLKKVLSLILTNSLKYTDKGYIEMDVNTIIKNNICRLIFTIEDSGPGIKSSELEKIRVNNKNLNEAYKMITLMNGTMLINSNYGVGTKVKIIMDQLMEVEQSKELKQYNEIYDNMKILVVDDNEATFKIIEKMLKGSKIEIDTSLNGKDCLNKIKSKNKYDVILLDEKLSQITGEDLLNKLKEIRNYNTPVILLTKDNRYEYNLEYKNMGFDDYIVRPFKKEVLLSKLDKFIRKEYKK